VASPILSQALLESAWAKPINLWNYEGEYDMVALAASLLFGIARNHAFAQGNKRTGLTSAVMFLRLNGYEVRMPDSVFFAELILAVIDGRGTEKEFTDLLRPRVVLAYQSPR
jgi:death on curing protein